MLILFIERMNIEITIRGVKIERQKIEGMNELGLQCIYKWKCHNETPCIAFLNKNAFFQKRKTGR
jgi:hypothetical protein